MNKYYGIPSTPTQDFLAHYGIPGMKWGVRRAIIKGNQRAFENHFRKAAKKLAKLQDRALNSGKYAAKAAGYGAAAAGVGTLAIGGTGLASRGIIAAGKAMQANKNGLISKIGKKMDIAGESLGTWGRNGKKQAVDVKPSEVTIDDVIARSVRKKRIVGNGKGIHKEGEGLGIGPVGNNTSNGIAANQPKNV